MAKNVSTNPKNPDRGSKPRRAKDRAGAPAGGGASVAALENISGGPENPLAMNPEAALSSASTETKRASGEGPGPMEPDGPARRTQMEANETTGTEAGAPAQMTDGELTLTRSKADRKDKRLVIYNIEGRTGSVQFLSTLFGGDQESQGNPPETLKLVGTFAQPKVRIPKEAETPEQRKARLAAIPKLTIEQQIAKAEEKARKLREKLAKKAATASGQPGTEQPVAEGAPASA